MFNSKLTKKHYQIRCNLPHDYIFSYINILPLHIRQSYIQEYNKEFLPHNMKYSGLSIYHMSSDAIDRAIFTGVIFDSASAQQFLIDISNLVPYTSPPSD
jgi:hypothetical protein